MERINCYIGAYFAVLTKLDKDMKIASVFYWVLLLPAAVLWGILVYKVCKARPKSYWALNLPVYLFPFIGIFIYPLTFGSIVADFVLSAKKMIPPLSLAKNNMIIKLVSIPMYIFYGAMLLLGAMMSVWGIGFIIYAPAATVVTIAVMGIYGLSVFIGLAKQKSLNIPLAVLASFLSFINIVDAITGTAVFIYLSVRAKKSAAPQTDISFTVTGEGSPLVLLHGNGENSGIFKDQIPAFKERFMVIAVDSRGHGKSPRGEGGFSLERFADDLDEVLRINNVMKANILGFSDGGNVALIYALKYPEKVKSLIVSGANLFPEGLKENVLADIVREYNEADSKSRKELLALMKDEPHIAPEELKKIRVPVLVTAGSDDMIKEEHTRLIADSLPSAELFILEGSHFVPFEKPREYNAKVLEFLARAN